MLKNLCMKPHAPLVHTSHQNGSRIVVTIPGYQVFHSIHIFLRTCSLCALVGKLHLCDLPVFVRGKAITSVSTCCVKESTQQEVIWLNLEVKPRPR